MVSTTSPGGLSRRELLSALAVPLLLAGCGSLPLGPDHILLSETQLAQALARQFPVQKRYLELFDLRLSDPRLRLLPDSNRVGTQMHYVLGESWLGARRVEGQMDFSYGLRFEPADASVRLAEVRVEAFELSGLGPALLPQARRLGGLVAEQFLEGQSIYRIPPERLQAAQNLGRQPGALQVVPGGVLLQLQPFKKP